jgi:hypothetical protein
MMKLTTQKSRYNALKNFNPPPPTGGWQINLKILFSEIIGGGVEGFLQIKPFLKKLFGAISENIGRILSLTSCIFPFFSRFTEITKRCFPEILTSEIL